MRERRVHDVVELVEAVARGHRERIGVGKRARALVDQRLDVLGEEPVGVLASLPDVEDPEDAGFVVEAGRVDDEPVEGAFADPLLDEVVVRRSAIVDRELLDVGDSHRRTSLSSLGSIVRLRPTAEQGATHSRHPIDTGS